MIKSVFIKYILAFLAIITISFIILASVISSVIIRNSMDAKESSMAVAANIARLNIETSFGNSPFEMFGDFINSGKNNLPGQLSVYSELTEGSFILVVDSEGKILVTTPLPSHYLGKDYILKEIMYNVLNQDKIDQRFQTLDGVFAERHLISAQSLKSKTGEICGALFFCSVSAYEKFFVDRIINTIILSSLWILAATMVILYFITEKIISPVRAMSTAAKSFALGRFDVKVPVKVSRDEIGELVVAFNNMASSLAVNEETQRTFLANVSHDLKTPMATIGLTVDGILNGAIPPDKHEYYLRIVSTEVQRLSRLVSSLLKISRIQAGEKKFNKTNFDICEMARLVIISLGQKIDEKNLEFEFNFDDDKKYVFADSDAVHQVLYNLIENAIKFTPEKGLVKINIADSEKEKEKAKKVRVSVYNTGMGIPSEDIPFVFDRFYKSDRSRGLDKTGVGLGLFIVKTIIDAHEEKIWVTSEYEKYCEFNFTLQKIHETSIKHKL